MSDVLWRCWTALRAVATHAHHRAVHHAPVGKVVRHWIRHHTPHVGHDEARAVWNVVRVCLGVGALLLAGLPIVRQVVPALQGPVSVPEPSTLALLAGGLLIWALVR